jgi:hypothetical protein
MGIPKQSEHIRASHESQVSPHPHFYQVYISSFSFSLKIGYFLLHGRIMPSREGLNMREVNAG